MDGNRKAAFFHDLMELLEKHRVCFFGPPNDGVFHVRFEDNKRLFTCRWSENFYDPETDAARPGMFFTEHWEERVFYQHPREQTQDK